MLSKFSGFSWERILHVSTWWCKFKSKLEILEEFFIWIRLGVLRIFKKLHFAWDSEGTFYGFRFTLRTRWRRICTVDWRSHSRHSPRFACLLALFTLARIASRFDYSILATHAITRLLGTTKFRWLSLRTRTMYLTSINWHCEPFLVTFGISSFLENIKGRSTSKRWWLWVSKQQSPCFFPSSYVKDMSTGRPKPIHCIYERQETLD